MTLHVFKVPCEKHGLEIYYSEGGKHYCEECMVERIAKTIEGYSTETIARWIRKNAQLHRDAWTIFRYAQLYHIEEVEGVILNPEFYAPLLENKRERFEDLEKGKFRSKEINEEEY